MENKEVLNEDDMIFFKEMIIVPTWGARRPYYKILKKRQSEQYIRFITIYKAVRPLLLNRSSERELFILDEFYGLEKESTPINELSSTLCISKNRVIQVRNDAEKNIRRVFLEVNHKKPRQVR